MFKYLFKKRREVRISRRYLLKGMAFSTVSFMLSNLRGIAAFALEKRHSESKAVIISSDKALGLLREGNRRYVSMKRLSDPGVGPIVRQNLVDGQFPYATILCCSAPVFHQK
jgi:hypothetical protein